MPNVTAPTRNDQNGQSSTYFLDSVSTTSTTYTYPAQQDALTVTNKGNYPITLTVNGTAYTIQGGGVQSVPQLFTSFTIVATGQAAFDAMAISETTNNVQQTGSNAKEPFNGTANTTHTFTKPMKGFVISNDGASDLTFTIGTDTYTVKSGEVFGESFDAFTQVTVTTTVPFRAYGRA